MKPVITVHNQAACLSLKVDFRSKPKYDIFIYTE